MNNVLENATVREALTQLPAVDRARVADAGKTYKNRLDAFTAILRSNDGIRARPATIAESLPDARGEARSEFVRERSGAHKLCRGRARPAL